MAVFGAPAFAQPVAVPAKAVTGSEYQDLLSEELTVHWTQFSSGTGPQTQTVWTRIAHDDPKMTRLVCSGAPRGFLHTKKLYSEFELALEWCFPTDPNGNSGVLVFTQNAPKLWPTSIQVQLHQPEAGSVFPVGEAVADATVKTKGLANSVGEWNQCLIVSRSGSVVVHVNGKKAGEVTGCKPSTGAIAIQSEGSEVHFRNIKVRVPTPETVSSTNENKSGDTDSATPE